MSTPAQRRRSLIAYGLAVATVGVTAVLKLVLSNVFMQDTPFLLLIGAVMLAAWYGGLGPGLLATVLADVASNYFFMGIPYSLSFSREEGLKLGLFLVEGISISILAAILHSARRRAESAAATARELEHTLAEVSEAEQRRLGRDLHDGLGQQLTGIALLSRALGQKLRAGGRTEAADANEIEDLVNESIDVTRDLARGLSPLDLDRTSLPAALRELAARTERLCRIPTAYEGDEPLLLADDSVALNLYRVAQEAVNNAVKHARPGHIRIHLTTDDERTALTVRDDGGGMAPGRPGRTDATSGMGLRIMKYRANSVGASFHIRSAPGEGTTVTCALADATPATEHLRLPARRLVEST